ncbi:MAG: hypothetical protein LBM93_06595 [Oscillospiraceae bacterium]|jgi:hypothetical protein|nr:hypothetical protein [Oscillospiraceae bacterium]
MERYRLYERKVDYDVGYIDIDKDADFWQITLLEVDWMPLSLRALGERFGVKEGNLTVIPVANSKHWVELRALNPHRVTIKNYLKHLGLKEYDLYTVIMDFKGICEERDFIEFVKME